MSHSQLDMLSDLARQARDQAGQTLAQERQAEQQTTAQLDALKRYRAEYSARFQAAMREGIDPASMYNYQQFLASLDTALERARQALNEQQQRVAKSQTQWRQQQRALSSYDTLTERRLRQAQQRQGRQEQKHNDDLVNSRTARRLSEASY
ncbi:flagellar export protein FliJ [Halomonas cibimaris]|uniref:Flagellar FliJ protein n=1 Tax=Halomonas cibimaris TaxID=657012 RepID=A0ABP7L637_9GAMM